MAVMAVNATRISQYGLNFIASFEGFRDRPYDAGDGHCTVAFGRLLHYGSCTALDFDQWSGLSITQGLHMLAYDVERYAAAVLRLGIALNQNQFDALTSFAYNLGAGIFDRSPSLKNALQSGDFGRATQEMLRFVNVNGVPWQGLINRRRAEVTLFSTPVSWNKEEFEVDPEARNRQFATSIYEYAEAQIVEHGRLVDGQNIDELRYIATARRGNPGRINTLSRSQRLGTLKYLKACALRGVNPVTVAIDKLAFIAAHP